MPALVVAADLADYPGAPFVESVVESAAESVRDEAGWHIAPPATETLTTVSEGGTVLLVPSLKVSAVTEIRDMSGDTPEVLTGWVVRTSGIIERESGWPKRHAIEVDLTHGYAACPPALKPVIAHRAQNAKMPGGSVRLGSLSTGYSNPGDSRTEQDDAILARYSL